MKPLLCLFQPRDIQEFFESVKQLPYDKLWLKYIPMEEARNTARQYFLEHEYTHFVILTDDLITTPEVLQTLEDDVKTGHFDIISGWCNGNTTFGKDDTDFSFSEPPNPPSDGTYKKYKIVSINLANAIKSFQNIIPVVYQGFNPSFISRRIVEQIPFRTSEGCCSDACFALDLISKQIPQFVDLRCQSYHMKKDDTEWYPLQVGKKEKEIIFEFAQ